MVAAVVVVVVVVIVVVVGGAWIDLDNAALVLLWLLFLICVGRWSASLLILGSSCFIIGCCSVVVAVAVVAVGFAAATTTTAAATTTIIGCCSSLALVFVVTVSLIQSHSLRACIGKNAHTQVDSLYGRYGSSLRYYIDISSGSVLPCP